METKTKVTFSLVLAVALVIGGIVLPSGTEIVFEETNVQFRCLEPPYWEPTEIDYLYRCEDRDISKFCHRLSESQKTCFEAKIVGTVPDKYFQMLNEKNLPYCC